MGHERRHRKIYALERRKELDHVRQCTGAYLFTVEQRAKTSRLKKVQQSSSSSLLLSLSPKEEKQYFVCLPLQGYIYFFTV